MSKLVGGRPGGRPADFGGQRRSAGTPLRAEAWGDLVNSGERWRRVDCWNDHEGMTPAMSVL